MQVFFWLAFLVAIGLAIFTTQNSTAPPVGIKLFIWQFETSLIYAILGSIASGMLIILLIWIPTAIRASLRTRHLKKRKRVLEEGDERSNGASQTETAIKALSPERMTNGLHTTDRKHILVATEISFAL